MDDVDEEEVVVILFVSDATEDNFENSDNDSTSATATSQDHQDYEYTNGKLGRTLPGNLTSI